MYKYALYTWRSDDEGGFGVCYYNQFTPDTGYQKYSGPWARPSKLIGGFNTIDEAVKLTDGNLDAEDIKYLLYSYYCDKGDFILASYYE